MNLWDTSAIVKLHVREADSAEEAVQRCARGRAGFALRAMDALHLGTALISRCETILSTHIRQQEGAAVLGVRVLLV